MGGLGRYKYTRVHRPRVSELGPRAGQASGYTFFWVSSHLWLPGPKSCPLRFAQLAMGYFNPPFYCSTSPSDPLPGRLRYSNWCFVCFIWVFRGCTVEKIVHRCCLSKQQTAHRNFLPVNQPKPPTFFPSRLSVLPFHTFGSFLPHSWFFPPPNLLSFPILGTLSHVFSSDRERIPFVSCSFASSHARWPTSSSCISQLWPTYPNRLSFLVSSMWPSPSESIITNMVPIKHYTTDKHTPEALENDLVKRINRNDHNGERNEMLIGQRE